jgi:hypothetical protein
VLADSKIFEGIGTFGSKGTLGTTAPPTKKPILRGKPSKKAKSTSP